MANELTQDELTQLFVNCYEDPVLFAFTFLENWFPVQEIEEITWFQRGVLALLCRKAKFLAKYGELEKIISNFTYKETDDGPDLPMFGYTDEGEVELRLNQFTSIYMPRGYTKTTLINTATLWKTVYKERKFLVYLSETSGHAKMQLSSIKSELTANELLRKVFGELRPDQRQDLKWTEDFIQTTSGVVLAAKGRGAQVRGLNQDGARPDDIVLDDVEDKESVRTAEQREKAKTWFFADVQPALPRHDPQATITVVGTLLHQEALMVTLENDSEFHTVKFGAYDKQGAPLWPRYMPEARIERLRIRYTKAGQLNSFMMEYLTTVRDEKTSKFKEGFFIWQPSEKPFTGIALAVDPAISERKGADYFAIAVAGMRDDGVISVLDMWGDIGVTPRQQVDQIFELVQKWQPRFVGIEAIAYQMALIHLVREEMFRKRTYFEVEEIRHGNTGKFARVEGVLQPRYAAGYIHHARKFPELESQLLDWPNGKRDYPDVLAMAITLLDPYAAQAADPEIDLTADEYEPLEVNSWAP